MATDFDWSSDEDVIMPAQAATAVYRGNGGGYIIRQQNDNPDGDGDEIVILADRRAVRALFAGLRALMKEEDDLLDDQP